MSDNSIGSDNTAPQGQRRSGVILFGHGARDPRWAEPFERLAERVSRLAATDARDPTVPGPVTLAYLELMQPSLPDAIATQIADGCTAITVVPVFFGQGAHLRRDFPALLDTVRAAHPGVTIRSVDAVGEADSVLDAIGAYVMQEWMTGDR